mgnify:CR=1 FL=1
MQKYASAGACGLMARRCTEEVYNVATSLSLSLSLSLSVSLPACLPACLPLYGSGRLIAPACSSASQSHRRSCSAGSSSPSEIESPAGRHHAHSPPTPSLREDLGRRRGEDTPPKTSRPLSDSTTVHAAAPLLRRCQHPSAQQQRACSVVANHSPGSSSTTTTTSACSVAVGAPVDS